MIDVHAHILPFMDDGSQSLSESAAMRDISARQGVTVIAATPHFNADRMTPDSFFEMRQNAYDKLRLTLPSACPDIRLGAEVRYFEGLTHLDTLRDFCISGTELLLLEMPFIPWSKRVLRDIAELGETDGITVVLAHIERYLALQPHGVWNYLSERGILMQANAEFFISRRTRSRALRMLKSGRIHLLGSDCHNATKRPPNLSRGFSVIEKHLGYEGAALIFKTEDTLFQRTKNAI